MRLLLLSNSKKYGEALYAYARDLIREHFAHAEDIVFVPYASADYDAYTAAVAEAFEGMGLRVTGIHTYRDPLRAVSDAHGIFIGGGNTFRLLNELYAHGLMDGIRNAVASGTPYMGASAGTNVATVNIKTTNDMPIVYPPSFDALNVVPYNINPHYIDADPHSTHMGETREERLREFIRENNRPVLGLYEGGVIHVRDNTARLALGRAKHFDTNGDTRVYREGDDIGFIMGAS